MSLPSDLHSVLGISLKETTRNPCEALPAVTFTALQVTFAFLASTGNDLRFNNKGVGEYTR